MASVPDRVIRLLRSPQGRRLTDRAMQLAKDPETRRKVTERARRIADDPRTRRTVEQLRNRVNRRR